MQLSTYLSFNGDCRAAFEFYAQCLGGKIVAMLPFRDNPMCEGMPPETQDLIMHGCVEISGHRLMGTDATPQYPHKGIVGTHIVITLMDHAEATRIFQALSENGKIEMPLQETFWAKLYGMTTDRFGVPWMINCDPVT